MHQLPDGAGRDYPCGPLHGRMRGNRRSGGAVLSKIVYNDPSMEPKPEKYEAIRCADHQVFIWSKSDIVKSHKGCDVFYAKKDGTRDE